MDVFMEECGEGKGCCQRRLRDIDVAGTRIYVIKGDLGAPMDHQEEETPWGASDWMAVNRKSSLW